MEAPAACSARPVRAAACTGWHAPGRGESWGTVGFTWLHDRLCGFVCCPGKQLPVIGRETHKVATCRWCPLTSFQTFAALRQLPLLRGSAPPPPLRVGPSACGRSTAGPSALGGPFTSGQTRDLLHGSSEHARLLSSEAMKNRPRVLRLRTLAPSPYIRAPHSSLQDLALCRLVFEEDVCASLRRILRRCRP